MATLADLDQEIKIIKLRNSQVEQDKSWETSWTRRLTIALSTYIAIGVYLDIINVPQPFLNAIVPSLGFMLSTLSLPILKEIWIKYIYKRL